MPGVWPTMRPQIASWISAGLVKVVSLVEVEEYARNASSTILITACYDGLLTGRNLASGLLARASAFL